MSNIYVVGHNTDKHRFVKVGLTTRSVFKRIGDWDTGSPFQFVVLANLQVPKDKLCAIERHVHQQLRHHHIRGEWFAADETTVTQAIAKALLENEVDSDEVIDRRVEYEAGDDAMLARISDWHEATERVLAWLALREIGADIGLPVAI